MNEQFSFTPTEKQADFVTSTAKFSCFAGGFGCVAGETKIFDPSTGRHVRIDSIKSQKVLGLHMGTLKGVEQIATRPKKYKKKDLYKVITERGRTILVTKAHKFFSPSGWRTLDSLDVGSSLLVYGGFHPKTILGLFQSTLLSGARYFLRKVLGSKADYSVYRGLYDEQLLAGSSISQEIARQLSDVPVHNRLSSPLDAEDIRQACSHLDQLSNPVSKNDSFYHAVHREVDGEDYIGQKVSARLSGTFQLWGQSLSRTSLLGRAIVFFQGLRGVFWTWYYNSTIRYEKIQEIKHERHDYYYDLHVPIFNSYFASGFINHNSGKTTACCLKSLMLSVNTPNNRGLIGRNTYIELRNTTRRSFFEICPSQYYDPAYGGLWKQSENLLRLANGSEILFMHLDTVSEKELLSLNLGWFFIDQAEEIGERVFQILQSRLRLNTVPNRYGFIACNPEPGNWIYHKFRKPVEEGTVDPNYFLIDSTTDDNPYLPADYKDTLLESYPEAMAKRYVFGRWDAFEGAIYPEFNRNINVVPPFTPPKGWEYLVALDHGMVNPTAALLCGIDFDGNIYVIDEYYSPGVVSQHAKEVIKMTSGYDISFWLIDPSTQAKNREKDGMPWSVIEEYEDQGLFFTPANNEKLAGINRVREFMRLDPKRLNPHTGRLGSPRLFIFQNCVNLIEEFPSYQWKQQRSLSDRNAKEVPVDYKDHALDALRYMIMSRFEPPARKPLAGSMLSFGDRSRLDSMTKTVPESYRGDDVLGQLYGDQLYTPLSTDEYE